MFISVLVTGGLGRPLVPWSIIEVTDEEKTFENVLQSMQAGRFEIVVVSDDLKRATLKKASVGSKQESLMVTNNSQSVCRVCGQFGSYVKLTVEVAEPEQAAAQQEPEMLPNAFSIMMSSQRRLQQGENGLPFRKTVKDGRDRMYNDLITLLREMGINWLRMVFLF